MNNKKVILFSLNLDQFLNAGQFKKLNNKNEAALSFKLEIALNLCESISYLHKINHFFIDFKPQNIRVFENIHIVTLLDCDGFSIAEGENRYPAELISTDYIEPVAIRESRSPTELGISQDLYALGVILFQLLNQGTHPFQGILQVSTLNANTNDEKAALGLYPHGIKSNRKIKPRPQSVHHLFDAGLRELFDRCFLESETHSRPSAVEWCACFKTLLGQKLIVQCDRVKSNIQHIRFKDMPCPACYLAEVPRITQPAFLVKKSDEVLGLPLKKQTSPVTSPLQKQTRQIKTSQIIPPAETSPLLFFALLAIAIFIGFLLLRSLYEDRIELKADHDWDTLNIYEQRPEIASMHKLTEYETRYCLSEQKRLGYIRSFIDNASFYQWDRFNQDNSDYDARCITVHWDGESLAKIDRQLDEPANIVRLQNQAEDRVDEWRREEATAKGTE